MVWSLSQTNFQRNIAVVIGINNYQNGIHSLKTAVNDASAIADLLEKEYKYQEVIRLFPPHGEATREKLKELLFDKLPNVINPTEGDRLLFYFAGHGIARNSEDGPAGALIPQDATLGKWETYLPMQDLNTALSKLNCHHLLVVLDCCFAGNFRWSSSRNVISALETIHREHYDRFIRYPAWQAITSAAYNQEALDYTDERGIASDSLHSPFAKALINGLKDMKADLTGDGVITAPELYLYLRDNLLDKDGLSELQTAGLWPLQKHDRGEFIFTLPGFVPEKLKPAPPLDASKNPYRGLESFDEKHSELFFGRTEQVKKLQDFVKTHALTVVLGASGSGKSSLVKAGLIPQLRQDQIEKWLIIPPIRPGETPLQALNNALKEAQFSEIQPQQPEKNLAWSIEVWAKNNPNSKLLLSIDQSEEIITLCQNEDARKEFFQQILTAIDAHRDKLRVVLSLRSDFEPQVRDTGLKFIPKGYSVKNTELKNRWQSGRFIVSPMTRGELREAIQKPAEARVMFFQPPELVEQLIDEVVDMPGALPLVSFALSELYLKYLKRQWEAQNQGLIIERTLTQEDYQELGGVIQSLTQRADEEYEALVKENAAYAQIIRHVMLRMVAFGGGELARRRVPLSELEYPLEKNNFVKEVIERFSKARLLVPGQNAEGELYVEPAHDALVRGWSKIKNWLDERQEKVEKRSISLPFQKKSENPLKINLVLQRSVTNAADNWWSKKISDGYIKAIGFLWYDDPRLPQLKQIKQSEDNWFNITEAKFVNRSILQKRINLGVITAIGASIFLAVLWQWQLSQLREKAARAENLLQTDPVNSLMLAIQATGQSKSRLTHVINPVEYSLSNVVAKAREQVRIESNQCEVSSVVFSPDGQTIVTGGTNGTITLWKITGESLFKSNSKDNPCPSRDSSTTSEDNSINSVAFSSDGQTIISGGNDGFVRLWDINGNEIKAKNLKDASQVRSIASSHNNNSVAVSYENGKILLWNPERGEKKLLLDPRSDPNSPVKSTALVTFSPSGQRIAAIRDGELWLWNSQGELLWNSLDEKLSEDERNLLNQDRVRYNVTAATSICSIAFSSDESILIGRGLCSVAEGSISKTSFNVEQWQFNEDSKMLSSVQAVQEHTLPVLSIASKSDGTIASGSQDNTIRLWNSKNSDKNRPSVLLGHTGAVNAIAFNPTAQQIASASSDGTIRLWDISDSFNTLNVKYKNLEYRGQQVDAKESTNSDFVQSIAFSPNGNSFMIGRQDMVMLFDSQGHLVQPPLKKNLSEENEINIDVVAFSLDGKTIISGSDKTLSLWDLGGKKQPVVFQGHEDRVTSVAFSPDGKTIVSGSVDNTLRLWDLEGKQLQIFRGHKESTDRYKNKIGVTSVAFSPNGQTIVSGAGDKTLLLWDLRDLGGKKQPVVFQEKHKDKVTSIAFSPDGKTIVSGSDDNTLRLWDLKGKPTGFKVLNAHTRPVKSVAFSPDGKIIASASADQTIKFWSLDGSLQSVPFQNSTEATYPQLIPIAFNPNGNTLVTSIQGVKESGSYLRLIRFRSNWQDWLQVACNRLQYHSILQNPETDEAKGAKQTCQSYVWNKQISQNNTRISLGDKILVSTLANPDKQAGVEAITSDDFVTASERLNASLKKNPNEPEALIYLNNAQIGKQPSHTIAVSVPISNDVNGALEILRGVAQAQKEINEAGGINKVPLRILIADDNNQPDTAKQIAEELVKNPNVLGVVGHYASDVTLATGKIYQAGKLVAVSPTSTSVKLTGFSDYIFRTVPNDSVAAKALADYMQKQLDKKNAAIFYNSQSDYSESLKSEFVKFLRKQGGEVSSKLIFDLSDPNFNADQSVEQSIESGAEVLVLLPNTAELDDTFKVVKANRQRLPLLGGDDVYTPKTLKDGGADAGEMVVAVPWHILASQTDFPETSRSLWKADVNWRTAMSYDATKALIEGLKNNPTREGLAQSLRSKDFTAKGETGEVQFNQFGDRDVRGIQLVKIEPDPKCSFGSGYCFKPVR